MSNEPEGKIEEVIALVGVTHDGTERFVTIPGRPTVIGRPEHMENMRAYARDLARADTSQRFKIIRLRRVGEVALGEDVQ